VKLFFQQEAFGHDEFFFDDGHDRGIALRTNLRRNRYDAIHGNPFHLDFLMQQRHVDFANVLLDAFIDSHRSGLDRTCTRDDLLFYYGYYKFPILIGWKLLAVVIHAVAPLWII
jgi:hypothetical protein